MGFGLQEEGGKREEKEAAVEEEETEECKDAGGRVGAIDSSE